MRYLKNLNTDPYYNMAFDEYCLENLAIDEPVFYLWQNAQTDPRNARKRRCHRI